MQAERPTILAVDDLPEYRRRYERRFDDSYEVVTAEDGSTALDLLDDHIDVVLLDRSMPDMDGDTVLTTIRAEGYDCRVAIVTANELDDDVIDIGFDAHLIKPVAADELNETVERLLARSSYDTNLQELYTLCARRAKARADGGRDGDGAMSTGNVEAEVDVETAAATGAGSDVAALEDRIRELRETVDDTVETFETADYRASFRDLGDR